MLTRCMSELTARSYTIGIDCAAKTGTSEWIVADPSGAPAQATLTVYGSDESLSDESLPTHFLWWGSPCSPKLTHSSLNESRPASFDGAHAEPCHAFPLCGAPERISEP
jgi:hypothetical protein